MRSYITTGRSFDKGEIRFRFAFVQRDRGLNAQSPAGRQQRPQDVLSKVDTNVVGRTARHFWNDPSFDEFGPLVGRKGTGFDQPMELGNSETARRRRWQRTLETRRVGNYRHKFRLYCQGQTQPRPAAARHPVAEICRGQFHASGQSSCQHSKESLSSNCIAPGRHRLVLRIRSG